jgi:four helix bundle protein
LTAQIRRSALSIPANIAEGYCRRSRADYLRFLAIAQGSAGELDALLSLASGLGYIEDASRGAIQDDLTSAGKVLTRLSQSLRSPSSPEPTSRAPSSPAPKGE